MRIAADAVERDIARYRIAVFAGTVLVTVVMHFVTSSASWAPTIFFAGCVAYAILLRSVVARFGARPAVIHTALLLDLMVSAGSNAVFQAAIPGELKNSTQFAAYMTSSGVFLVLVLNTLRANHAASIVGAIAGAALYIVCVQRVVGPFPAQYAVASLIVFAGLVSFAAATEARKNLDRFARLSLLRRYLPAAAVERVMQGDPDAATALGGKLVTVTILASDLRGFTAMSEKLSASDIVQQLNAYHGAMITVVERWGGAIDKFIGDGMLVVFGFERAPEEGARAAVSCAKEMRTALAKHNAERAESGLEPLRIGVGVHTGSVVAGNIGAPGRRLEFTVIGDVVNTATRIEGLTKDAKTPVLISEATAKLLDERKDLRKIAPMSMRGKVEALDLYALED